MSDKDIRANSAKLRAQAEELQRLAKKFKDNAAQANHNDFMMRGEEEVFLAMMDKLGVKLDPKELRDFDLNNLQ